MSLFRWIFSSIFTSLAAIGVAFYISSAVMGRSQAQNAAAPPVRRAAPMPNPAPGSPPSPQSFTTPPPGATMPPPQPPAQVPPPGAANGNVPDGLMEETSPQADPPPIQNTVRVNNDDFVFDPTGMRDPFKPYKALKPIEKNSRNVEVSDPLQNLELDSLELVAILWDVRNPRALVRSKAGTIFTLKRDTKVGRNNGVVAGIREGEVIVLESYEEDGRVFKQYSSIKMASASDAKGIKSSSNQEGR